MNPGPRPGRSRVDHTITVETAWNGKAPDWVMVLAEHCNASNQTDVARRISYSSSVVSQVLSNTYRGDISRVEEMVSGAFMASVVLCPELGEIGRDRCLDWQKKPYAATSSHRVQMFIACKECELATRARQREELTDG